MVPALQSAANGEPQILFLHVGQGGQFEFFGKWMARQGWGVTVLSLGNHPEHRTEGIRLLYFQTPERRIAEGDFRAPLDYAAANAYGVAQVLYHLREVESYRPDVVMAHVGWGVGLCVKDIWPATTYIAYHEWYYTAHDWSGGGRPERPSTLDNLVRNRLRNLPISAEFDCADAHWCPTEFQASRFPPALSHRLTVIHDGVDCSVCCPDATACIDFSWLSLPPGTPLVTYTTRGMEPIRGFPQFMRATALLQQRRSDVHTLILGRDRVSYGAPLPDGESWLARMLDRLDLDHQRLHIHDPKPRAEYLRVLQTSSAHVYLTEPFVTSWSLSEALASGALVIGSNTAPVEELIDDAVTGLLVDMDDPEEIVEAIEWALDTPQEVAEIRKRAREKMLRDFADTSIFPRKLALIRELLRPEGSGASLEQRDLRVSSGSLFDLTLPKLSPV